MNSAIPHFSCHLSSEGNLISIIPQDRAAGFLPEEGLAKTCKTHEAVLALLEQIRDSEVRNQMTFYHENNTRYGGHMATFPKGHSHPCPLELQIDFIKYKIAEKIHGVRGEEIPYPTTSCTIS